MNKNAKIISIIISAVLIMLVAITLGLKMNKDKKQSITNKNSANNHEIKIEDTCEAGLAYPDAIEEYYKDDKYVCKFNQIRSGCYVVKVDGKEYSLKDALNNKVITVEEAIENGMYCEKIVDDDTNDSNTNTNSVSNSNVETNTNSNSNTSSNTNSNSSTNKPVTSNTNSNTSSDKFSNVISSSNVLVNKLSIIDRCGEYTTQVIDEFYQDSEYIYYFTSGRSGCTYVNVNGKEYSVKSALNDKIVTMKELEDIGFKCNKKSRDLVDK